MGTLTRRAVLAQVEAAGLTAAGAGLVFGAPAAGQSAPAQAEPAQAASARSAAVGSPPSAAVFAAEPVRNVSLSPDGSHLAWLQTFAGAMHIVLVPASGQGWRTLPLGETAKARSLRWISDDWMVLDVSVTREVNPMGERAEFWRAVAVNRTSGAASIADPGNIARFGGRISIVANGPAGSGQVYTRAIGWDPTRDVVRDTRMATGPGSLRPVIHLWTVGTREYRQVSMLELDTVELAFDDQGRLRARQDADPYKSTVTIRRYNRGAWPIVAEYSGMIGPVVSLEGMHDARRALILDRRSEFGTLAALDLETGETEILREGAGRHFDRVRPNPHDGRPVSISLDSLAPSEIWLEPALEAVQGRLNRAFPGKHVTLQSWSRDFTRILAFVDDPAGYPEFYLYNTTTRQASPVGAPPEGFAGHTFARRTVETFSARDGLAIQVIVTTPPGGAPGPRPAVMLPHGGPNAQDSPGYDDTAQFLASRGYLVLQPQFRGSTGFGQRFMDASVGEWGGKMQDDVSDCVRWAVETGRADPARVAIMGYSYGGYAALFGATATPDLYRCAISISGVSDLPAFLGWARTTKGDDALEVWRALLDSDWTARSDLNAISPRSLIGPKTRPVLLIHGKDDTVVPQYQSATMRDGLRAAGIAHHWVDLGGEDHWMTRPASRQRVFEETERFLAAHMA